MNKDLKEYRAGLIQTVEKLNNNYDKLIITLSGGALALSLTFLKDIVKQSPICSPIYLISSWGLFILSLTCVLGSLLFGIAAYKKAIAQVDARTIYKENPGGLFSKITTFLHYAGTIFLLTGLVLITIFIYSNMEAINGQRQDTTAVESYKAEAIGVGTTWGKCGNASSVTRPKQERKLGTTTATN